jgi:2-methylisocitrate lyase-like PEP mutase family enzyme
MKMQAEPESQSEKSNLLFDLHHNGKLLVLPNIWDPLGALLLESLGYPAVATASASIAFSNGYPDGEKILFRDLIGILKNIVKSVTIPVTADIESGYAENNSILTENIKKLIDTGIAGINIEDSRNNDKLFSIEAQCEKISIIKKVADQKGEQIFINARTDVYIKSNHLTEGEKLSETIRRGNAYKDAGADCFYPILLKKSDDIGMVINEVNLPLNILLYPGIPDFDELKSLGVARLSLGPGFLKIALNTMKNTAEKLLHYEGMSIIADNPVTSAYVNSLITKE